MKVKSKSVSKGSLKRKQQQSKKKISKGAKTFKSKHTNTIGYKENENVTKQIQKKNEAITSARAISNGSRFFLSDINDHGKNEIKKQKKELLKKESNNDFLTKMKKQLKKAASK